MTPHNVQEYITLRRRFDHDPVAMMKEARREYAKRWDSQVIRYKALLYSPRDKIRVIHLTLRWSNRPVYLVVLGGRYVAAYKWHNLIMKLALAQWRPYVGSTLWKRLASTCEQRQKARCLRLKRQRGERTSVRCSP